MLAGSRITLKPAAGAEIERYCRLKKPHMMIQKAIWVLCNMSEKRMFTIVINDEIFKTHSVSLSYCYLVVIL